MSAITETLTADEQVNVTLTFVDAHGNAVTAPGGVPAWTVDNTAVLTVTPAEDGMSAELVTVGPVGTANVTVSLDSISGSSDVTVTPGALVSITLVPGTPANKS